MSGRLAAVVRRREHLLARTAEQRRVLAADARLCHESLTLAGAAFRAGRMMRRHPASLAVVIAILWWLRRRSVLLWGGPIVAAGVLCRIVGRERCDQSKPDH